LISTGTSLPPQGLQGFAPPHGIFAAHGFLAAHGLHGLQARFFAAQGLHPPQRALAPQGYLSKSTTELRTEVRSISENEPVDEGKKKKKKKAGA
jgi:hypothetical protein